MPLEPCPSSPNCVSSLAAESSQYVEPFDPRGDAAEALARLATILKAQPRTKIEQQSSTYLHAVCTTPILRFRDDVEFMADISVDPPVIHVRSASRIGYSDLGANRRRVEDLRAEFEASYAS